jgi:hypothetical protein
VRDKPIGLRTIAVKLQTAASNFELITKSSSLFYQSASRAADARAVYDDLNTRFPGRSKAKTAAQPAAA